MTQLADTLLGLLMAVGLSHLIVDGSIFASLRGRCKDYPWLAELISCYQCTGFWTGALVGLLIQPVYWNFSWLNFPLCLVVTPLLFGAASSYLSIVGAAFLNYLDAPAMMISSKKTNESKTENRSS